MTIFHICNNQCSLSKTRLIFTNFFMKLLKVILIKTELKQKGVIQLKFVYLQLLDYSLKFFVGSLENSSFMSATNARIEMAPLLK
jgi:hypothetical protein